MDITEHEPPRVRTQTEDRVLEAYYADVRAGTLPTPDTERALFKAYRTCSQCARPYASGAQQKVCLHCGAPRNFKARDQLVEGALRFVLKVAKDYSRMVKGNNYDSDLLKTLTSAGNVGLLIAIDRFDIDRGTRFLTYAAWWIREEIYKELDNAGLVRVPVYRQKALRAKRKRAGYAEPDPACVTIEDLTAVDTQHQDEQLERNLVNTYGTDLLHEAMQELGFRARDRYILVAYFGVHEDPKNLRQLARRLGLSSERIRLIKKNSLKKLRGYLEQRRIDTADDVFAE